MCKNCMLIGTVAIAVLCLAVPAGAQTVPEIEVHVDGKGVGDDALPTPPKIYEIADLAMWPTGPCDLSEPRLHKLFSSVIAPTRREEYAGCMQSCAEVIADASLPFELRRKAQFSRIYMLANTAPPKAVEEGRQWLAQHPDDRDGLMLRRVLFLASCIDMQPLDRIAAAFQDLETHHPATDWNVIWSRVQYAQKLHEYGSFNRSKELCRDRLPQLLMARDAILTKQKDPSATSLDRRLCKGYLQLIDGRIDPKSVPPEDPAEKAYVEEMEKKRISDAVRAGILREVKKPDGTIDYELIPPARKGPAPPKPTLEDIKKWYPLTSKEAQKEAGAK